jgi:hypothetical protein
VTALARFAGMHVPKRSRTRRGAASTLTDRSLVTYKYRPQHGVIVVCEDETHQREVYDRLRGDGLRCKVVTV